MGEERTERMKNEAERTFGLQKRLTAFEKHVEQVCEKIGVDFDLKLAEERAARERNSGEIDSRALELTENVRKLDNKHEDFHKQICPREKKNY